MTPLMKRTILLGVVAVAAVAAFAGAWSRQGGLPPADPAAAAAVPTSRAAPAPTTAAPSAARPPDRVLELQQRLTEQPQDAAALAEYVDYLFQAKRYAQAADVLAQAVEASPRSPMLRGGLGMALFYQGMPALAQRELRQAIEIDPNSVMAHFNYALIVSHGPGADLDAARTSWETVARLDPEGDMGRRAREFLNQPPGR